MPRTKRKSSEDRASLKTKHSKTRHESSESVGVEDDTHLDTSVFGELTGAAGLILKTAAKPNQLKKDAAVFQRDLLQALRRHLDYPQVVDEFVENLEKHLEDKQRFRMSLMPTHVLFDPDGQNRAGNQDSMIRLFLGITDLQPKVMKLLLEKLAEFSDQEETLFDDYEQVNMPRLIIGQLRWLDSILIPEELVDRMLELLEVCSLEIQREIIACLPEVLQDSQHNTIATRLKELMEQNSELAVPVLDSLSSLAVPADLLLEVRSSVTQLLPSVKLEDLPVIVRFLLQTVSTNDAFQVVTELRANLDLETSFPQTINNTNKKRGNNAASTKGDRDVESLTLDAIRAAIRFQQPVAEAWLKAIEGVTTAADHRVLDLFVLLMLHANNHRKPVQSLLRNKIRSGHLTEQLLQQAFTSHTQALKEYFSSIQYLAESLLRSAELAVSHFGQLLYRMAFMAFDAFSQQELVASLVGHLGSGFSAEVDASLDVLQQLTDMALKKMLPYAVFVKGMLDYLDHLNVGQIRKLYCVLSVLAFRDPQAQGMLQDELHILIRKQLSHDQPKYQRMGVIAAIMVVRSLAHCSSDGGASELTSDTYKEIVALLQLVRSCSCRSPEAAALFMDELSDVVRMGSIHPKVEEWISDNVISDFQDFYIIDVDPEQKEGDEGLPMRLQYGLDDDSDGAIAVNLLPLMVTARQQTSRLLSSQKPRISPLCLATHFRLLQICEKRQHGGQLEDIDALLGCAVLLPKPELKVKLESLSSQEKEMLCDSCFLSLNWFREVVNAFAMQSETEMKAKVISRLQNITELQLLLQASLAVTPGYKPPPAHFDLMRSETAPKLNAANSKPKSRGRKPQGKGKKRKKKGSKNAGDDSDSDGTVDTQDQTIAEKTQCDVDKNKNSGVESTSNVDLVAYNKYFRELDFEVFTILQVGLITRTALDTEMNTKDTTTLQLQPPQLQLLLRDLTAKLQHSLLAKAPKRLTFLKRAEQWCGFSHIEQMGAHQVAKMTVGLLPALLEHLEAANTYFQAQINDCDGVVDGPSSGSEESLLMADCLHLLLQALLTLFSWIGFSSNQHKTLLHEALGILASRLTEQVSTQINHSQLCKEAFVYLEHFAGTVPSLAIAVTLARLLQTVFDMGDLPQLTDKIVHLCETLLKRDWRGPDGEKLKGATHNAQLQHIMTLYLKNSDETLKILETLSATAIPELIEAGKNGISNTYPSLNRFSYPLFYKVMLMELVTISRAIASFKQNDSNQIKMDKLLQWNMAVRIFHILVNLLKVFDARTNIGAVLKFGRQFVEVFIRQGMPLLDHMFRGSRDDVTSVLKNLQLSTRALQHLCGHSKITQDLALTNQVPLVRRTLEQFVYRVKAMLKVNNCLEAFWLGNLKNRDLRGDEILSQVSQSTNADNDSDDESDDVPDDDSDVEMDRQSEASVSSLKRRAKALTQGAEGSSSSGDENYSETF